MGSSKTEETEFDFSVIDKELIGSSVDPEPAGSDSGIDWGFPGCPVSTRFSQDGLRAGGH